MSSEPIDLGHGHTLQFTRWAPDRELNPHSAHLPDVERYGALVSHQRPDGGGDCMGGVTFDGEVQRQINPTQAMWTVESWDPLTLSPSLLCSCGDHGFVRDSIWVPA